MLDAYQCAVVAVIAEDGGGYEHREHYQDQFDQAWEQANDLHPNDRYGYHAEREYDRIVEEELGLRKVIRFEIREAQSYELELLVDYYMQDDLPVVLDRFPDLAEAYQEAVNDGEIDDGEIGDTDQADRFVIDWLYDNVEGEVFCDTCGEPIE